MRVKHIIIKIDNLRIHLSPTVSTPIRQSSIPVDYLTFRSHYDIYWAVELIDYNIVNKCWRLKVIDYSSKDIQGFECQKFTEPIDRLAFEPFDWKKFERHLSGYQKQNLLNSLENYDVDEFYKSSNKFVDNPNFDSIKFPKYDLEDIRTERKGSIKGPASNNQRQKFSNIDVEFNVYFSEAKFMMGYVLFCKKPKNIDLKIDFKIKNDFLLPEFDNIKSWFAKVLKSKKFKVYAKITMEKEELTEVYASSPQIDKIDANLIDSIKYERTLALTKTPNISVDDKSLFTANEIFGEFQTEDLQGNVFKQSEQDILRFMLDNIKTRNKKQLEYLAGAKQSEKYKLKFTLNPNFGFLFCIEGKENNHFVWELLNSHATYIWTIDKSEKEIHLQYKKIEATINTIRNLGREKYKRAYRMNHHDDDLVFSTIEHEDITSEFKDGFVKWKHKLNERIT